MMFVSGSFATSGIGSFAGGRNADLFGAIAASASRVTLSQSVTIEPTRTWSSVTTATPAVYRYARLAAPSELDYGGAERLEDATLGMRAVAARLAIDAPTGDLDADLPKLREKLESFIASQRVGGGPINEAEHLTAFARLVSANRSLFEEGDTILWGRYGNGVLNGILIDKDTSAAPTDGSTPRPRLSIADVAGALGVPLAADPGGPPPTDGHSVLITRPDDVVFFGDIAQGRRLSVNTRSVTAFGPLDNPEAIVTTRRFSDAIAGGYGGPSAHRNLRDFQEIQIDRFEGDLRRTTVIEDSRGEYRKLETSIEPLGMAKVGPIWGTELAEFRVGPLSGDPILDKAMLMRAWRKALKHAESRMPNSEQAVHLATVNFVLANRELFPPQKFYVSSVYSSGASIMSEIPENAYGFRMTVRHSVVETGWTQETNFTVDRKGDLSVPPVAQVKSQSFERRMVTAQSVEVWA